MKWSNSIRKWSRLIHRDLSFFFAGMVLIYAISGIVMNHRDTINPNFSIERKEYKITGKLPGKEGMKKEKVLTLLQPLGEEGNYTKHYFPKADIMKVFLKGWSNLQVNVSTGEAVYESVTRRPLIGAMARLHYNPGQWWTYFADIFAVGLIIITLSHNIYPLILLIINELRFACILFNLHFTHPNYIFTLTTYHFRFTLYIHSHHLTTYTQSPLTTHNTP